MTYSGRVLRTTRTEEDESNSSRPLHDCRRGGFSAVDAGTIGRPAGDISTRAARFPGDDGPAGDHCSLGRREACAGAHPQSRGRRHRLQRDPNEHQWTRLSNDLGSRCRRYRRKILKLDLQRFPGYQFFNGRNTVEVWAQTRRGRSYYSSFVVKTVTENWNEDFTYQVFPAPGAVNEIPPQVWLLEPDQAINVRPQ